MGEEENGDDSGELLENDHVHVHLFVQIWLKNRPMEMPMNVGMRVRYELDDLPGSIQDLTESYASILMGAINDRSKVMLALTDENESIVILELDQVQAFQVVAPARMPEELEQREEEE